MAEYQELKLRFERVGEAGDYRVFASGPAGEAAGTFKLPYSDVEVENLVLKLSRPRSGVRRIDSSDLDLVRGFGGGLFDAVFSGRVRDVYRSSLASARNEGCGMRISLALTGTPELMHVPWEYLYDEPAFLSISMWTPVVRYLDLPSARRPLKVSPPLRILGMVSSPSDIATLDVGQERAKLEDSLGGLVTQGAVEIHWLEQATLQALQRELRRAEYHVFHYIGHGGYDRANEDGVLALEDGTGRSRLVSGMELGTILADEMTLRLAVLNACEGARSSVDDPFSGVATSLVRREIPAVIAMQLEITDRAAITFACELYAALADGYAVDAALAEARKAIFADENEVEWATPVLFMRVPDGRIFDIEAPVGAHTPVPEPPETPVTVLEAATDELPPPIVVDPVTVAIAPPVTAVEPERVVAEPTPVALAPVAADTEGLPAVVAPPPSPPAPVVPEPRVEVPRRLVALLAASTFVLLLAIWFERDGKGRSWWNPNFGDLGESDARIYTVPSPLALVLVAGVATVLAASGRRLQLAAGLLVGCGIAASAKYLGVLGRTFEPEDRQDVAFATVVAFAFVLAASLVLILVGIRIAQLAGLRLGRTADHGGWVARALVGVSGLLVLIACLVPFNAGGGDSSKEKSLIPNEGPLGIDGLVVGLALLAIALCLSYVPRVLAGGILLALGLESAGLWLRYWGIPLVHPAGTVSPGPAGVVGLVGALVVIGVGAWLAFRPAPGPVRDPAAAA